MNSKNKKQIANCVGKSQKGITLIALVITIIVLLILAGVTINMVFDDKGIITQAEQAELTYNEKADMEIITLAYAGEKTKLLAKDITEIEAKSLDTQLEKIYGTDKVVVNEDLTIMIENDENRIYKVNTTDSSVTKLSGIEVNSVEIKGDTTGYTWFDLQLEVVLKPDNATNKEVIWSSSDEDIAEVDEYRSVHFPGKKGEVTITAEVDGVKDTHEITVECSEGCENGQILCEGQVISDAYDPDNMDTTLFHCWCTECGWENKQCEFYISLLPDVHYHYVDCPACE